MICVDSDFSTLESLSLDHEISGNTESCSNPCPASQEHISGTEAAKSSEVVTPSKLSKSVDLLSIYISGYIRRLALCFHHDNFRDKTIDSYKVSRECIEKTHEAMAEVWMTINQQYTLYRALHKSDELAGAVEANGHGPRASKKSQIYNLYVCVNSLDLHLQALLHTTRELTTSLEGRVDAERRRQAGVVVEAGNDDGKVGCVTAEDEEQWTDVFKRIKLGLESCKSCYDESLKHLHSKLNKESVPSSQPAWRETSEASTKQSKLKVIPAEDPVIVDQVFEAMSEAVNEDVPEVRPRYTAEDRARIQEQREMMKRLRQELHAVVGHRAIFQREREERALARARGELGNHEDIQAALSPVIGQKPPVVAAGNELQGEESDRIPQPCVSEDSGNSEAYADLALLKQSVAGDANAYGCSSMTGTGSNSSSEDDVAVVSASTREAGAAKDARTDPIAAKCSHQNTAECSLNSQSEEDGKTFQHNLLLEKESLRHLVAHDMEAITSEETNRVEAGDEHRVSSTTAHSSAEGKDESGLHSAVTTPDRKDSALSVPSDFHGCLSHKYFVTCEPETTEVKNCTHWGKEGEACEVQDLMGYENVVPQHPPNIVGPDWPYSGPEEEAGEEEDPLIDNWVKISHQEMTSPGGSRMELIREKEINLAEVLQQARPAISSPDPNSSFSKSLAVMAAARARNFNSSLLQEEEFGDDGSGSEIETDESNE